LNYEQLKKLVGTRVQLVPVAHRLDDAGRLLPRIDDDWIVDSVVREGIRIANPRAGQFKLLGLDQIHSWTSNPDRVEGGHQHGFLMLKVQLTIKRDKIVITPNSRPGESVAPPEPPNPIRFALLARLADFPGSPIHASHLPEFDQADVTNEIARSINEGLINGRVKPDTTGRGGILAAVALNITPRGVYWLRTPR
jgi:hypothetical protein